MFSRNIGLITEEDQRNLHATHVLIAGSGGMGGVCAEVLVRMGAGELTLIDHDRYEETNFNRQIYSNKNTIGKFKVEVLKEEFLKINPNLKIRVFTEKVTLENINELLRGVNYVVNGMDEMYNSLILERTARRKDITIVDAWLTPYASVFVMTPDSPHWEDFLDLPTKGIPLEELTPEICNEAVDIEVDYTFSHFSPYEIIDRKLVKDIVYKREKRPSFAPVVWLSGVLMANEVFKLACNKSHTDYRGIFFDQYEMQLTQGAINKIKKAA
ncbi:HesA/MoeB/ThiF family protein [Halobacteriovorax marinus]|uniref:HesA/MoeB/ThiF family protein n=1 Tax=Halobacteriovorax marinus TaxID=97084 RepID=UPI003A95B5F0